MCNMYPFNRHSALVCALVRCQCFQGFAVLCVQEFKLTLSTPEVETFPFPRMHRFGPDQLLEPFLLGGDVASPYVGANALFAGPGGGLVALASLLFLQEDLIHWVLIFPNGSKDLFRPARQEFLCFLAAMVLVLTGCPDIRVGQLSCFSPHSLSARSLTCCLHELSAPTFRRNSSSETWDGTHFILGRLASVVCSSHQMSPWVLPGFGLRTRFGTPRQSSVVSIGPSV